MLSLILRPLLFAWPLALTAILIASSPPLATPEGPASILNAKSEFFAMPVGPDAEPGDAVALMWRPENRTGSRTLTVDRTCDTNPDEDGGKGFFHTPANVSGAVGSYNLVVV